MLVLGLGLGMVIAGARPCRPELGRLQVPRRRKLRLDAVSPDRRLDRRRRVRRDLRQPSHEQPREHAAGRSAHPDCGEPGRSQTASPRDPRHLRHRRDRRAAPRVPRRSGVRSRRISPHVALARDPAEDDRAGTQRGRRLPRCSRRRRVSRDRALRSRGSPSETSAGRRTSNSPLAPGVDLAPPELWLLTRLGERTPLTEAQLIEQVPADPERVAEALDRLRQRSLVGARNGDAIDLTALGREDYERIVTARCTGLRELLDGWEPDEHAELRAIDRQARARPRQRDSNPVTARDRRTQLIARAGGIRPRRTERRASSPASGAQARLR